VPEITTDDATLYVEVDGEGEPVTVFAHGLTNSRKEMAQLTPFLPGTKVRFDFRGHGRSSVPETGYGFEDFARDVDDVARAYGATRAAGTSLGAGALCNLVAREPDRFERLILLLPAALDIPLEHQERFLETAAILESAPRDEALAKIMSNPDRLEDYAEVPWMRELADAMWSEMDPIGVARSIRGVIGSRAIEDREQLRAVEAPTLIVCRDGDPVHPLAVGEALADLLPNSELHVFPDDDAILRAIPQMVARVNEFLA
jgi:pimeloyl-ACP methyl ester carboxylesterase